MPRERLDDLIAVLRSRGYQVLAPVLRDGVIRLGEVKAAAELAAGWRDEQGKGSYRLRQQEGGPVFASNVGPDSPRTFLHPPMEVVFRARKTETGLVFEQSPVPVVPLAFLGLRACDVAARLIQDRVLLERDASYRARREASLVIAVQCTRAGANCFCAATDSGPAVAQGADVVLTEVGREFLVEARTSVGESVIAELRLPAADAALREAARQGVEEAARAMEGRFVSVDLLAKLEHPHWEQVAERCLACANCTMVCPTCFCSDQVDTTDLAGSHERRRVSDSCFNPEFSWMGGRPVRSSVAARYRQWLTHKLSSWQDQFGTPGCVGCGRCITWCPAGIDLREEARALQ